MSRWRRGKETLAIRRTRDAGVDDPLQCGKTPRFERPHDAHELRQDLYESQCRRIIELKNRPTKRCVAVVRDIANPTLEVSREKHGRLGSETQTRRYPTTKKTRSALHHGGSPDTLALRTVGRIAQSIAGRIRLVIRLRGVDVIFIVASRSRVIGLFVRLDG